MNRILSALLALTLLAGAAAQTLTATVPGDRLGWEADELDVVVSLLEPSRVRLEVYSPGFDPDDYRASLAGLPELGDERYDGGDGDVSARFSLARSGVVVFERSFGVEPHATAVLFDGELGAGEYSLRSTFEGLGKNTFVYTLESEPAAAIYFDAGATMLFNVRGHELQEVLTVEVDAAHAPATFELYDGDGPGELRGRLDTPSGPLEIPVSGDLEWSTIRLGQPGTYTFSFYQPEGAYQHSNTIGLRADSRLLSTPTGLEFMRQAPVDVRIVDVEGTRLAGNYRIETEGDLRTVVLTGLPERYELVDTRSEGGVVLEPGRVNFGSEGGTAIFVARRVPAPVTTLTVTATLVYPGHAAPYPLALKLDRSPLELPASGETTVQLDPGVHVFRVPAVPGARVSGPSAVVLAEGDHQRVDFVIEPRVTLDLTVDVFERTLGERFVFTATGATLFEGELPGTLAITLPPGLAPAGPAELTGTLSAGSPLVLTVPADGAAVGDHAATADLAPWELTADEPVRVVAPPAAPEPAPEPEPEPEAPAPEPEPETPEPEPETPTPEPEPEPQVQPYPPVFKTERRSTVHLSFQAGRVLRCELPPLGPGDGVTQFLNVRVVDPGAYADPRLRPEASPAGDLEVYFSDVRRDEAAGTVTLVLQARNVSDRNVQGSVLIPLPLGTDPVTDAACVDVTGEGEGLLLGHTPPEGGSYVAGSSVLDGLSVADPTVSETAEGTSLVWLLPWREAGTLSYEVAHETALPPLAEPQLTTLYAERERALVGSLGRDALNGREEALLPTELVGAARLAGDVERLDIRPVRLVADGRNPLVLELVALDAAGNPIGDGLVSVAADREFVTADADPLVSGQQVLLVGGVGRFELAPAATAAPLSVSALAVTAAGDVAVDARVDVLGTRTGLYQAQLSVTASFAAPASLSGFGRGYLELPVGEEGTLQAALDAGAGPGGLDVDRSLARDPRDSERFPLAGTGTEAAPTLASSDGFAVLYSTPGLRVGYLEDAARVPGLSGLPRLTGAHGTVTLTPGLELQGYAALVASGVREQTFAGDGTRRYGLGEAVSRGSERVYVVAGDSERELERGRDYVIDDYLGAITLMAPLAPYDAAMNPQSLRVVYAPDAAPRDTVIGGFGARYRAEGLKAEVGVELAATARLGASLDWRGERLDARGAYQLELTPGGALSGSAEVGFALTPQDRVSLRHVTARRNTTTLGYAHRFDLAEGRELTLSAGLARTWELGLTSALAGVDLRSESLTVGALHTQPFSADAHGVTDLKVGYDLTENLTATVGAEVTWGVQVAGVLGLTQRIGASELSLSYELPTASGAGNRARFGVRAPFALTRELSLDLTGGVTSSFEDGSLGANAGAALRYRTQGFVATVGGEVATGDAGFKVVLRAGAAGQLGEDQALSFDANYQVVPELEGRFGVAYSLKRGPLDFLTYHRLINRAAGSVLEGEIAPTLNFANRLQLRPDLAYRVMLDDPDGSAYQASLFAVGYLTPTLGEWHTTIGLGLGGHALWQPGTDSMSYGVSAEVQARVVDEAWLAVGYTFGGFEGITSDSRGGLYLRLDLVTGGQF